MEYITKTTLDCIAKNEILHKAKGILYLIKNVVNNKVYVGISSNSFATRYGLEFKTHNEHLSRSIEKYGLENFEVYIIVSGEENYSRLLELEKQYINEYRANEKEYGYNKTLGGEGTLGYQFTEEDYLRIHVPVVALRMDGTLYKEYVSQKQAYDELGVYVSDALKLRVRTAHNLIWLYKSEYDTMSSDDVSERVRWANNGLTQIKAIVALDLDGAFVREFDSVIEASRILDCSCGTLTNCCKHIVKTYRGFIWFYKTDYENLPFSEIEEIIRISTTNEKGLYNKEFMSIPVVALDLDTGDYRATYPSAHYAEDAIRVPNANAHIIACCKGKLVSCYGFKWCYESDYLGKTDFYRKKIADSINGRQAIVALDINTGELIKRYSSLTEALRTLGKKGGGSISKCCAGKLNSCYGYRWMYENDYERQKENITSLIADANELLKQNRSKCRSIPVVIVIDGDEILKESISEMSQYIFDEYGISNVRDWFKKRGIPQRYKNRIEYCGSLKEYKTKYANKNNE